MNTDVKVKIGEEPFDLLDGLMNLASGLGGEGDKRAYGQFINKKQLGLQGNQGELIALYRTDWLAGKVVDIIPDDMTREWRAFDGDISPEIIAALEEEENRLQLAKRVNQAHKWSRLFGTAFIVMSIDDGQLPEMPLDINKIKPGGLRFLNSVDRHRVSTADVIPISDPLNRNFGYPEFYRFVDTNVKIHHSRVLRFDAVELPFDEFRRNNYNSDPIIARLYDAITNLNTVTDGSASMVYESNVDVYKIKNFMQMLQNPETQALLHKRFAIANVLKSFNNALILDAEEEHEVKNKSFSGLPDLLDRFAQLLSAATDIPATRLLGISASGFNSTGEGDLKNYYDMIRSRQKNEYKPMLDYFDKIMAKSLGVADGSDLSYDFNSLFQMTPLEISTLQNTNAQRDAVYLDRGVVSEAIVAKQLVEENVYTNISDEDIADLEEYSTLGEEPDGNDILGPDTNSDDENTGSEET